MPFLVACPTCQGKFDAPDHVAGKKVKCPLCKAPMLVPTIQEIQGVPPDSAAYDETYSDAPPPRMRVPAWLIAGGIVTMLFATIGLIALAMSSEGDSPADKPPNSKGQSRSSPGSPDNFQPANKSESRSAQSDSGVGDLVKGAVGMVFLVIFLVIGFALYILPTFIAFYRKHQNAPAIAAVNILLGWFFIGWVAALVKSMTEVRSRDNYHYHFSEPPK
jgi:hypothetical protein